MRGEQARGLLDRVAACLRRFPFSSHYRPSIRPGLIWVVGLGILSAMTLDMRLTWMVYRYSLTIYAALLADSAAASRPADDDRSRILKWSFPVLYFGGFLVYPYVWHLRGILR